MYLLRTSVSLLVVKYDSKSLKMEIKKGKKRKNAKTERKREKIKNSVPTKKEIFISEKYFILFIHFLTTIRNRK